MAARAEQASSEPSTLASYGRALACVVLPGPCIAAAASDAYETASASASATAAAVETSAADAVARVSGGASGYFAGVGDTIVAGIRESAAPVAETASATRYAAVAVTVVVVALVLLALVVTFKVL